MPLMTTAGNKRGAPPPRNSGLHLISSRPAAAILPALRRTTPHRSTGRFADRPCKADISDSKANDNSQSGGLDNRLKSVFSNNAEEPQRRSAGLSFAAFPSRHQIFRYVHVTRKDRLRNFRLLPQGAYLRRFYAL